MNVQALFFARSEHTLIEAIENLSGEISDLEDSIGKPFSSLAKIDDLYAQEKRLNLIHSFG
jgi:hypothetical protein